MNKKLVYTGFTSLVANLKKCKSIGIKLLYFREGSIKGFVNLLASYTHTFKLVNLADA